MLDELGAQSDPDDPGRTLLDSIELIIPHQANKTMILNLAGKAGLSADQLYFNVERMGNVSAASIPIAVYDAIRDGVITRPVRVFAPGFGAGAVGGYAVMRIDPAIVADEVVLDVLGSPPLGPGRGPGVRPTTSTPPSEVRVPMSQESGFAFGRIAIVNRGEPAMRLINAVREWNAEGRPALRVIAVYTAADRHATFVREADEAVLIGPDPKSDADAAFAGSPYLDYAELERALRACRADAVWPGWGFVSEKAEFAELVRPAGHHLHRPAAEVMRRLGDKIESKRLAEQAGVPLAPWSGGAVADAAAARAAAESIGYPLMVKATAGGGGRGIRLVASPEDLDEAFERASSEASKTAGDATVFLEQAIRGGRHVEVQVVADTAGTVWTLGVRDCSVQRRNQKVIEESASTALDAEQEKVLRSTPPNWPGAPGTSTPGRWSFSTNPARSCCRSWRSTPGCRWSTRLPRSPPASTSSSCSCISRRAARCRRLRPAEHRPSRARHRGPAHRRGPGARLRARPGLIEHLALPAPASGSTPG